MEKINLVKKRLHKNEYYLYICIKLKLLIITYINVKPNKGISMNIFNNMYDDVSKLI